MPCIGWQYVYTNCQPINEILRYLKASFDATKALIKRKQRFSQNYFSVCHMIRPKESLHHLLPQDSAGEPRNAG